MKKKTKKKNRIIKIIVASITRNIIRRFYEKKQ